LIVKEAKGFLVLCRRNDISLRTGVYELSSARPAAAVINTLRDPVSRAVLVNATAADSKRQIICAENTSGDLAPFDLRNHRSKTILNEVKMNDTLRDAAESFCASVIALAYVPAVSK
jgi:hypothetical protein